MTRDTIINKNRYLIQNTGAPGPLLDNIELKCLTIRDPKDVIEVLNEFVFEPFCGYKKPEVKGVDFKGG